MVLVLTTSHPQHSIAWAEASICHFKIKTTKQRGKRVSDRLFHFRNRLR